MKAIGIIAAMDEEIAGLLSIMHIKEKRSKLKTEFYIGELADKKIILAKCGIGKVNAAACTQMLIDLFDVEIIINIGVAGGLDNKLNIGDLVIAEELVQHDFDTSVFGDRIGFISRLNKIFFESDQRLINIIREFYERKKITAGGLDTQKKGHTQKYSCAESFFPQNKIYFGRIASGDKFVCNSKDKTSIRDNFNALCVEMESAAIAHVCYLNSVGFVVIRAISDGANKTSVASYKNFLSMVTKGYTKLVKHLILNT